MEKKKLKLSISGSSKKTFNSIEQAKTNQRIQLSLVEKLAKGPENTQTLNKIKLR